MYATEKPTKRKKFRQAVQLLLMVCLVGVLLVEPVKNTLAYVTSSPVKVVNTFEGVTETETTEPITGTTEPTTEETDPATEPMEPTEPTETIEPTEPTETVEPTETPEPTVTTTVEESSESSVTSAADGTTTSVEAIASPTGDSSRIGLYAFLAVMSLTAIILLYSRGRDRSQRVE